MFREVGADNMQIRFEIPASFWGLFRSVNREIYIESLLYINEEYQYSNYFLTKEICVQILSDMNAKKQIQLMREEDETETDLLETTASRILKWLLKSGWLKKIDDYQIMLRYLLKHLKDFHQKKWKRQRFIFKMSMQHCFLFKIIPE